MSRLADVNGDGKLDLVSPEIVAQRFAVAFGAGDGTFLTAQYYALGFQVMGLDTADLDADGDLDVVAISRADANIYVAKNQGDGTFAAATHFAAPAGNKIVAAKLDADARPELITLADGTNGVSVFPATSTGFGSATTYDVGAPPTGVAVADLDSANGLDIVVSTESGLTILKNLGNLTFAMSSKSLTNGATDVAVAEFNGDGKLDIAVASTTGVTVLPGDGTTTPGASGGTYVFPSARSLAAADIDHDGDQDLAAVGENGVMTLLAGAAGFVSATYPIEGRTSGNGHLAVGDLDNDGDMDLAISSWTNSEAGVVILRNPGDAKFTSFKAVAATSTGWAFASGDLDGDGDEDVVRLTLQGLQVYLQEGGVLVAVGTPYHFSTGSVAIGDVDGDGRPDVIVAGQTAVDRYELRVFKNLGQGALLPSATYPIASPATEIAVVDLDGNCAADLVLTEYDKSVAVLENDGAGGFAPEIRYDIEWLDSAVVADFTGDGIPDIAGGSGYGCCGTLVVLRGNGDATFTPLGSALATKYLKEIGANDIDGDGDQDLIVETFDDDDALGVYRGHGDGTFDDITLIPSGYPEHIGSMDVIDFDGDGVRDVVIKSEVALGVHIGHTNGTFEPIRMYPMPGTPRLLADLDGDHRLDAITVRETSPSSEDVWQVHGTCNP